MNDEILIQEAREQLEAQGLDEDTIEFTLEAWADEGAFLVRDIW